MKRAVRTRDRILRARRIQHLQAAAHAAEAENMVQTLTQQSHQIATLGRSMAPAAGPGLAMSFAGASEMAMRLRDAEVALARALATARAGASRADEQRIEARVREESAARLVERARVALSDAMEHRAMLVPRPRPRRTAGEVA